MAKYTQVLFVAFLLLSVHSAHVNAFWKEAAGFVGGCALVAVGAPIALGAIGFTSAGIVGGSTAAAAMSTVYSSGVGLAALSAAQSAGAVGAVATSTMLAGGAVGAGVAHATGCDAD